MTKRLLNYYEGVLVMAKTTNKPENTMSTNDSVIYDLNEKIKDQQQFFLFTEKGSKQKFRLYGTAKDFFAFTLEQLGKLDEFNEYIQKQQKTGKYTLNVQLVGYTLPITNEVVSVKYDNSIKANKADFSFKQNEAIAKMYKELFSSLEYHFIGEKNDKKGIAQKYDLYSTGSNFKPLTTNINENVSKLRLIERMTANK